MPEGNRKIGAEVFVDAAQARDQLKKVKGDVEDLGAGSEKASRRASAAMDGYASSTGKAAQGIGAFGVGSKVALGVVAVAAAAAGAAIVKLTSDVVQMGIGFNRMREQAMISFTTLLKSAGEAKTLMADLTKFANETPFELSGLIPASQKLLAMGFAAKDIIPTLRAVGDAVAAMGGSAAMVDRVTTALVQMRAKGKVHAEEMMQLAEAGIPAWEILSQRIGKSIPDAMKLVEKGAVSADVAIGALIDGMSRRYAGMMEQQSRTFTGLLSTVKDTAEQIAGEVLEPVFFALRDMLQVIVDSAPAIKAYLLDLAKDAGIVGQSFRDWTRTFAQTDRDFALFLGSMLDGILVVGKAIYVVLDTAITGLAQLIGGLRYLIEANVKLMTGNVLGALDAINKGYDLVTTQGQAWSKRMGSLWDSMGANLEGKTARMFANMVDMGARSGRLMGVRFWNGFASSGSLQGAFDKTNAISILGSNDPIGKALGLGAKPVYGFDGRGLKEVETTATGADKAITGLAGAKAKAGGAARAYANSLVELTKRAKEAEAALMGDNFAAREAKIQADIQAERRHLEINRRDKEAALAALTRIENAQLEKVAYDRVVAEKRLYDEIRQMQITGIQDEYDRHRATADFRVERQAEAMIREMGISRDTTDKIIAYKRAVESEFFKWLTDRNRAAYESISRDALSIYSRTMRSETVETGAYFERQADEFERHQKSIQALIRQFGEFSGGKSIVLDINQLNRVNETLERTGLTVEAVDRIFGSSSVSIQQFEARLVSLTTTGVSGFGAMRSIAKDFFNDLVKTGQIWQILGNTIAGVFQSAISGQEKWGDALIKGFLTAVAQIAAMLGNLFILAAAGLAFIPGLNWSAGPLIAAGVALLAFAGVLQGIAAGIGGGDRTAAATGGAAASGGSTGATRPSTPTRVIPFQTNSGRGAVSVSFDASQTNHLLKELLVKNGAVTVESAQTNHRDMLKKVVA